jgi:hypothetical protein
VTNVGLALKVLGLNFGPPKRFGWFPNLENAENGLFGGIFDFVMEILYNTFITSFVRPR